MLGLQRSSDASAVLHSNARGLMCALGRVGPCQQFSTLQYGPYGSEGLNKGPPLPSGPQPLILPSCNKQQHPTPTSHSAAADGTEQQQQQQQDRQQQLLQKLQQQWQAVAATGRQRQEHVQNDSMAYSTGVGCVVLPREGSKLYTLSFHGNVPSTWYLHRPSDSSHSSSNWGGSSSGSGSSSANPTAERIGSWPDLCRNSMMIQEQFRGSNPHSSWASLLYVVGKLKDKAQHQRPSCPRADPNRLARHRFQYKLYPMFTELHNPRGYIRALSAYNSLLQTQQSRLQQQTNPMSSVPSDSHSPASKQLATPSNTPQQQQQQRYQQAHLQAFDGQLPVPDMEQQRRQYRQQRNRCKSRSSAKGRQAAAAKAAEKLFWGERAHAPVISIQDLAKIYALDNQLSSSRVWDSGWVPPIQDEAGHKAAKDFLKTSSVATVCVAERDADGHIVSPLPEGCIAAGCSSNDSEVDACSGDSSNNSSSRLSNRRNSQCLAGIGCDLHKHIGRQRKVSSCMFKGLRPSVGDPVHEQDDKQHASSSSSDGSVSVGAAVDTPAEAAKQLQQQLQRQGPLSPLAGSSIGCSIFGFPNSNMNNTSAHWGHVCPTETAQSMFVTTAADAESANLANAGSDSDGSWNSCKDAEEDSDLDDNNDVMFDDSSDDGDDGMMVMSLPPELLWALREPCVFRNSRDVIYGFWSKCPMG